MVQEREENPYLEIDFQGECDLHYIPARDTGRAVRAFLQQSLSEGRERIVLIHGKGKGVRKAESLRILRECDHVLEYNETGGNWGRTVIRLKQNSNTGNITD
jgi:DNA-nicking Smr family endonuclease